MCCISCILPQKPGQLNGIAKGIYFKFPLPYPRILIIKILFPTGTAGLIIKRICIRIHQQVKKLTLYNSADQFLQFCTSSRKIKIRSYLRSRIPQPHSRNIPCDHMHSSIRILCHCSLQGISIASLKLFCKFRMPSFFCLYLYFFIKLFQHSCKFLFLFLKYHTHSVPEVLPVFPEESLSVALRRSYQNNYPPELNLLYH